MNRLRRLLPWLAALLLGLGTALFVTNPAWKQPGRSLICNWVDPDCLPNHWLLVWVAERLSTFQGLGHNDWYYWPVGDAPFLAGNGGEGFLYLPFHLVFGWPGGVVWYALTVLTCNGLAAYALARQVGGGRWASLLATGAVAFSPLLLHELSSGRFTQVSVFWLLCFMVAWMRLLEEPSACRAALAAVLLAATSFFYWYYGFFGVLAGAILALGRAIETRRPEPGMPWRVFGGFCALFLALIAPWAWWYASGWAQIPGTNEVASFPHPDIHVSDWPPTWPSRQGEGHMVGLAMALSLFAPGLLGACGALLTRRLRALVAVTLFFYALSLGPVLAHSPYELIYRWAEPLRRFWWPVRHAALWQPLLAALGALAVTRVAARTRTWLELPITALLLWAVPWLLIAQGVRIDVVISSLNLPPPVYPALATRPGAVMLEPPISSGAASARQQTLFQLWHKKTQVTGHALWVDRVRPPAWDTFVADNSFLAQLAALEKGGLGATFRFEASDLRALIDRDLSWISLNRELFPMELGGLVESERSLFNSLFGAPVASSRGHWVWDTGTWTGASEVTIPAFDWPRGLEPGNGTAEVRGRNPASAVFSGRGGP